MGGDRDRPRPQLKDASSLTEYYRATGTNPSGFVGLQEKLAGFAAFVDAYSSEFRVHRSFFYDAYIVPFPGLKVGIAGFNSAWRCSQVGQDNGRLLIGTDLVDAAAAHLDGCDAKLCLLHHPFDMFAEWNRKQLRRRLARQFQFLFTGHVHDSDVEFLHQIFGNVFVSTSGALNSREAFNFYSIVQIDLAKGTVTSLLRKWYDDRDCFDQETEKAAEGRISYSGFRATNEETAQLIEISEIRGLLHENSGNAQLVNPLEGVAELKLRDVFVEPIIKDRSSFDRDDDDAGTFTVDDLLRNSDNLVFFGQPEFGKSMLLEYAERFILTTDGCFEGKLPARIKFRDLPKNNFKGISHIVRRALGETVTREQAERYLADGRLILLIDDFNDRNVEGHDARCSMLREFYENYPKCRYILTLTEFLSQAFHYEALRWGEGFAAKTYFISSFNTAKIRQLLVKVSSTRSFGVNAMLDQIVFYFQQLQIPVTPLAVTLFLGVLFRDRGKRNIQNEAYLVENYLETVLEKLNPGDRRSELDFRERESFLAHIAFRMLEKRRFEWPRNEFERGKLDYFDHLDEKVPDVHVFEDFFKKGILQEVDGTVSYKFKFWFHFFLAKAMEKDESRKAFLLGQPDYLRYATALGYKAGLSRNDAELLENIRRRSVEALREALRDVAFQNFDQLPVDAALSQFSEQVEKDIVEKNSADEVDARRDALLPQSGAPQKIDSAEECDDLGVLVTLHSDIIRNTREVPPDTKVDNLRDNVSSYVALMWGSLVAFKEFVTAIPEEDAIKLLFRGVPSKKQEVRLKKLVEGSHRLVYQIVPISVICYMTDHLGNPKLSRSVARILDGELGLVERLFHLLLLFRLDPSAAFEGRRIHP
ncbi:MAG: hypothetical protein H0X73_11560 [Chthoniobacterales bacterium]|nr:hypothetical protein [Chthoniobacterales bacterium]